MRFVTLTLGAIYLVTIGAVLLSLPIPSGRLPLIAFFVAAEFGVLPLRLIGTLAGISVLYSRSPQAYLFLNLSSIGALAICALCPAVFLSPLALQLAFGSGAFATVAFRLLTAPSTSKTE